MDSPDSSGCARFSWTSRLSSRSAGRSPPGCATGAPRLTSVASESAAITRSATGSFALHWGPVLSWAGGHVHGDPAAGPFLYAVDYAVVVEFQGLAASVQLFRSGLAQDFWDRLSPRHAD